MELIYLVIVITVVIGVLTRVTPIRMFIKGITTWLFIWIGFSVLGIIDRRKLVKAGRALSREEEQT